MFVVYILLSYNQLMMARKLMVITTFLLLFRITLDLWFKNNNF